MRKYIKQSNEIGLSDMIKILKRNFYIIISGVVIGVVLAWTLSYMQSLSRVTYSVYTSNATMQVIETELETELQMETLVIVESVFLNPELLRNARSILKISAADYSASLNRQDETMFYTLSVSGRNSEDTKRITNEMLNQGKSIIDSSSLLASIDVLELGELSKVVQTVGKQVNWLENLVLGFLMGSMVSIFYIFAIAFLSTKMIKETDLEKMFDSVIIGRVQNSKKGRGLRKFYEVI